MKIAIELSGGRVQRVVADEACQVIIVDRDVVEDSVVHVWEAQVDHAGVDEAFRLAAMDICDACGRAVPEIIGSPYGPEVCQDCFDSGLDLPHCRRTGATFR